MHPEKRGTGRTFNMLADAMRVGMERKFNPIVIMHNRKEVQHALYNIVPLICKESYGFSDYKCVEHTGLIMIDGMVVVRLITHDNQIIAKNNPEIPWTWTLRGIDRPKMYLDHALLEAMPVLGMAFKIWTQFDNQHHKVNFRG